MSYKVFVSSFNNYFSYMQKQAIVWKLKGGYV